MWVPSEADDKESKDSSTSSLFGRQPQETPEAGFGKWAQEGKEAIKSVCI